MSGGPPNVRPAWIEIDSVAIAHNASVLRDLVAPALLCAVVKADGYAHDAVAAANAALSGGAAWLAVALVEEGEQLRSAGIDAPVLVLSEPPPAAFGAVVEARLRPTLYTADGVAAAAEAARAANRVLNVHLKVNTGMNRVGARPDEAVALARRIREEDFLALEGVWTHLAAADAPDGIDTESQLAGYRAALDRILEDGSDIPMLHVANSAALISRPDTHLDMVRAGIALYGVAPTQTLGDRLELWPAMRVLARVTFVNRVSAGERISYGLTHEFARDANVATVPIGYADGVRRQLAAHGGVVLIGGRRRPIVGVVTMDQLMVDCGDDPVAAGDEVVLLGEQGDERIDAWEWAERLDTIGYEVICGFGPRLPRVEASRAGGDGPVGERST